MKIQISVSLPSQATIDQMWAIYEKYYHTDKSFFQDRIAGHNHFVLFKINGALVGFTGVLKHSVVDKTNKKITLIGLGLTAIEERWRNKNLIQNAILKLIFREFIRHPWRRVYLWSVACTFRPYLIFARGLKTYYPNRSTPMPPNYQMLVQQLFHQYYAEYDLRNNLVYFPGVSLKEESGLGKINREEDKDLQFYFDTIYSGRAMNGREARGVMTIAPANWENILFGVNRMISVAYRKFFRRTRYRRLASKLPV